MKHVIPLTFLVDKMNAAKDDVTDFINETEIEKLKIALTNPFYN